MRKGKMEYMHAINEYLTVPQAVWRHNCNGSSCVTCMYRRDAGDYSEELVGTDLPAICTLYARP